MILLYLLWRVLSLLPHFFSIRFRLVSKWLKVAFAFELKR